jgi:hypothetical protein
MNSRGSKICFLTMVERRVQLHNSHTPPVQQLMLMYRQRE